MKRLLILLSLLALVAIVAPKSPQRVAFAHGAVLLADQVATGTLKNKLLLNRPAAVIRAEPQILAPETARGSWIINLFRG